MIEDPRSVQEKALHINLDAARYGTFAEIGAGQEVARWFFHVGKASSTVARSISAYDMAISDALYGAAQHYVSRARLEAMIESEFHQLVEQLNASRGDRSAFFVFADTVATHGSTGSAGGHGWLGVRFQDRPRSEPSEVIIHIQLLDAFSSAQQETVGLTGVNLIYGCFTYRDPVALIRSLMDGLDRRRIEIDMIKFSGPAFAGVDNRLMSLQLVQLGFTDAVMLAAGGEVIQPSEVLHNRAVLIERGSFRPVTNVAMDMLDAAMTLQRQGCDSAGAEPLAVMEMTLHNLMSGQTIDHADFLARAGILGALEKTVMISNYTRFDLVTGYLRRFTQAPIGMAVGIPTLQAMFDEKFYAELGGGILESLGRLFRGPVKLFVYPTLSAETGALQTAAEFEVSPNLRSLYAYLFENGLIVPVRQSSTDQLHINPAEVLRKLQSDDPGWADFVPDKAAALIRRDGLFGYGAGSH
jgi:hypothetical protein